MKRLLALVALAVVTLAAWTWNSERLAVERACEILTGFEKTHIEPNASESADLHDLARGSYALRRAALANIASTRCPSWAGIFYDNIYVAATRLEADTLRRLSRDLSSGGAPNLGYETDAAAALEWYRFHGPSAFSSDDPERAEQRWLDAVQLLADRLPERRAAIEEELIWPRVIRSNEPDFVSYLSNETRRRHLPEILEGLLRLARAGDPGNTVVKQAAAFSSLLGAETAAEVVQKAGGAGWFRTYIEASAKGDVDNDFVDGLISRDEQCALDRQLEGEALQSAQRILLDRWLHEVDWRGVSGRAKTIQACVPAMRPAERSDALEHALETLPLVPRRPPARSLDVLIARLVAAMGEDAPLAALQVLESVLVEDPEPFHLQNIAEALARDKPEGRIADFSAKLLVRLVDQPHPRYGTPPETEVVTALCGALPEAYRPVLADKMIAVLRARSGDVATVQAAACLVQLSPDDASLDAAMKITLESLDRSPSSGEKSSTLRALAKLAMAHESQARRRQMLQIALDHSAGVVQPACAELAALAPDDDLASIASILRMSNCSRMDRGRALMDLSKRLGLPRDAFGRAQITSAALPTFDEDLVRVALWLEARGL